MATTHAVGKKVRVGIIGGSIAGCAVAIELSRAGYDVAVFERSRGTLVGRGAGISLPMPTFRSLIARDLIDADFPTASRRRRLWSLGARWEIDADRRRGRRAAMPRRCTGGAFTVPCAAACPMPSITKGAP
ncbi:MAG: NAD(P)-binding protein [Chloroflexota bacterium]